MMYRRHGLGVKHNRNAWDDGKADPPLTQREGLEGPLYDDDDDEDD